MREKRGERGSRGKKEGIILDLVYGLGLGAAGADGGKGTCVREGNTSGLNPDLANISTFSSVKLSGP